MSHLRHNFQQFVSFCCFWSMFARIGAAWSGCSRRMGNITSTSTTGSNTACVKYVQEVVSQNCVVIFSKTTCPYCKMAKNVFNEIGAHYKVIELDEHDDGRRLQDALAQMTGARTVPRVFINGNCIGAALTLNSSISRANSCH